MGLPMQSWVISPNPSNVHLPTWADPWLRNSHLPHSQTWPLLALTDSEIKMFFVSWTKFLNLLKKETVALVFYNYSFTENHYKFLKDWQLVTKDSDYIEILCIKSVPCFVRNFIQLFLLLKLLTCNCYLSPGSI